MYSLIKTSDDQVALNQCLDQICQWCLYERIEINFSKSSYAHITNKKSISPFQYQTGDIELTKVETFMYFVVTIGLNFKSQSRIINICAKACHQLCMLRQKLKDPNTEVRLTA